MGCAASAEVSVTALPKKTREVIVKGADDGKFNVIIIGAGAAGLGAAQEALRQGLTVKVLEARNRLGGRIESVDMGPYKIDMGASWIHGIGPGCGEIEEWKE
jgi:phytoene dehydrogenase-like protein